MARVTVRYWAAAREAAGVAEEELQAATLADALVVAADAHGERLAHVLKRCSFVVDEQPVGTRPHDAIVFRDGSVIEVLPPFAGGAHARTDVGLGLPGGRPPFSVAAVSVAAAIALGAALSAASWGGHAPMTAVLAVAQAAAVVAWFAVAGRPARMPNLVVCLLAFVGADIALLSFDGGDLAVTRASSLGPLAAAAACALLGLLAVQLARRDGRPQMTPSLAAGAAAAVLVVLMAAFVALRAAPAGRDLTVVAFVAVACAALAMFVPGAPWVQLVPAAALAAAAAAVAALLFDSDAAGSVSAPTAAAVGAAAGLLAWCGRLAARRLAPAPGAMAGATRAASVVLATTLPLALVAPVTLVVGRVLTG